MEFFVGTFWAFVPAIIAIVLALITKQVYLSLFVGIFAGAMFLAEGNPLDAFNNLFGIMGEELGGHGGILIFLIVLGIFSVLMVKTGGSKAYGEWASSKIKTKAGAELATVGLGALIFVDDYFNCLTVGSAMRPVTDKHKISHAKLAYLIDATAAPICIIAPISSWAAAGSTYTGGIVGFIKTIPFNMYALLTIGFMIVSVLLKLDFFKMKRNEKIAQATGDLNAGEKDLPTEDVKVDKNIKGRVANLVFPVVTLIVCCVASMIYNGWAWLHTLSAEELLEEIGKDSFNVLDMFAQCDSSIALATGSFVALIITLIFYYATRAISFKESMESIVDGFKSMVPAILILTFAWTLSSIMGARGGNLDAKLFVETHVSASNMQGIIPFVFFLIACLISFATGTSWGTFNILLAIAVPVLTGNNAGEGLVFLTMSAVLAGSVYGDHVSPISDTTIMASSGAQCNHLDHVRTQLPYATIVALISGIVYLITGFITTTKVGQSYGASAGITLAIGFVLLAACLVLLYFLDKKGIADKMDNAITGFFGKLSKHPGERPIEETIQGSNEVSDQIESMQNDEKNNKIV